MIAMMWALGAAASGQVTLPIEVSHTYPLAAPFDQLVLPLKCDADRNLYGRFGIVPGTTSLVKIAADGHAVSKFDYSQVPKVERNMLADFFVTRDGEVYALAQTSSDSYLALQFSNDGALRRKTEIRTTTAGTLAQFVTVAQFVALPNGNFFISGTAHINRQTSSPFASIYNAEGKRVREIKFRDAPVGKSQLHRAAKPRTPDAGKVAWGLATLGDDQNLYIMQARSSAVMIYVLNADGRQIRTLTVPLPVEKSSALYFAVENGRVAIAFASNDGPGFENDKLRIADSRSGKLMVDYQMGPETGHGLACYANGKASFLFLIPDNEKIIEAEVR